MGALFFKIFSWFWLTILLIGLTFELSAENPRATRNRKTAWCAKTLPEITRGAAETFERSGEQGLAVYLDSIEQQYSAQAFLLDDHGQELIHHLLPRNARTVAEVTAREAGMHLSGQALDVAGMRGLGPSGRRYSLILLLSPTMLSQPWLISPYFRLPFILLISSVFLYVIVRYVTNPLLRLRAAAAHIGEGRLDTRVSPELAYRNDEIADLGRDFDRMACRIESLVNAQRQLLGNASHELRSPLSRLMIALALVKQGAREEVPEHLERIGLEARRLDKLIGQLLTLSRIESRADQGPPELLDLTHLVERVASDGDFEARAHLRRVVVMAADPCDVSGYDESLRSAIENVVRNAIRHTREGSTVEISLQRQQGPTCSKAKIHIRDYGPGVAEHLLTRIFQPFNRVPSDGQTSADGAGLGLAITESAVRAHGGTVRATNAVDGGLVVDIELPLPH